MTTPCHLKDCGVCERLRSQRVRGYIYRTVVALGALAGIYGWASGQEIAAWIALAGALTGCGLAAKNAPVRRRPRARGRRQR